MTTESTAADEPTVEDFCSAVARAPKDDVSLEETRVAAADVKRNAPPEVRGEVTTMREAVGKVSTVKEMEALIDQEGRVQAAWRRYHAYIEEHCFLD